MAKHRIHKLRLPCRVEQAGPTEHGKNIFKRVGQGLDLSSSGNAKVLKSHEKLSPQESHAIFNIQQSVASIANSNAIDVNVNSDSEGVCSDACEGSDSARAVGREISQPSGDSDSD